MMKVSLLFCVFVIILGQSSDELYCNKQTFRPAVDHTCAIDNHFHHVHCWGPAMKSFDFAPPPDVEFVKIDAIHLVGCGLSKDGRVFLWGRDHHEVISKTPTENGFIDVSCGVHHACGIKEDNKAQCWGLSSDNRLNLPAAKSFTQIECGNEHSCGLTVENTIECWGYSAEGRLNKPSGEYLSIRCGHGHCYAIRKSDKKLIGWGVNSNGQLNAPSGWDINPKHFDLGYTNTCVINQEDKLKCFGNNHHNLITTANTKEDDQYKDVKVGHTHICALTMENKWDCWGEAAEINSMPLFYDWINSDDCGRKVVEVDTRENTFASAHETACALDKSNLVICWGTGTMSIAPPTIKMKTIVSSQHNTYCGLTMENGVKCWGTDHSGVTSGVPTRKDLISVTAGHDFACAITEDYLIVCWGKHGDGREYVPVNEFYKVVENGMYATCGITFTGKIECWGTYNSHGMLNHPVDDTKQYVDLHCNYGCCALDQDRKVECWGYNSHGEVSKAPTDLTNIKELAAGLHHFCVLKEDDSITCWGRNLHGESTNPSGNDWLALGDMGIYVSCAMTKQKEIKCWGQDIKNALDVPTGNDWLPPGDGRAQKKTWLTVGTGSCPHDNQTGQEKNDISTVSQCRDHCFSTHLETYFAMTTKDNGDIVCACYKDCDLPLTDEPNVVSYEVLSDHVRDELQEESQSMIDYRLRFGKSLEKSSFLEKKFTSMTNDLATTTKDLKEMTASKRMWEERFLHVKVNELSKLAEDEYPSPIYDAAVGSSNAKESTSTHVLNWLTLVLAVGAGTGIGLWLSTQKKMKDETESLL